MSKTEIHVLDYGLVALKSTWGDDRTAAHTARTSYRNLKPRTEEQDKKLTEFLVRHKHNTPLEFCQLLFYMKMPIFVKNQLVRHRTASINEMSLRYVEAVREFYIPSVAECRKQSDENKQCSSDAVIQFPNAARDMIMETCNIAFDTYLQLRNMGMARETARTVLPLGTYTEWYFRIDLHNFLHLVGLRFADDAQFQTRFYAEAMLTLAQYHFPTAIAAWKARGK